ncbi:hypothetical protein CEXT_459241 [Caerostris extrusa]|uniref:Uncharacterized protein n=1 Tax=Caerostris extrusa TaxID=172846 RepID=A0AAV4QBM6_CAEEX|nr:hypothetical protein CEXT_459241 [Caerostris extrusa]
METFHRIKRIGVSGLKSKSINRKSGSEVGASRKVIQPEAAEATVACTPQQHTTCVFFFIQSRRIAPGQQRYYPTRASPLFWQTVVLAGSTKHSFQGEWERSWSLIVGGNGSFVYRN